MSKEKLVAFIDLLGTKDSHKVSVNEMVLQLTLFAKILVKNAPKLDLELSEISHFSDCAYISTSRVDRKLFDFLADVRLQLLENGLYFKCGVDLAVQDDNEIKPNEDELYKEIGKNFRSKIEKIFTFQLFGREIVSAYLQHENLKGVGFSVSNKALDKAPNHIVDSIFVNEKIAGGLVTFKDIRFQGKMGNLIIDSLPDLEDDQRHRKDGDYEYRNVYFDSYLELIALKESRSIFESSDDSRKLAFVTNIDSASNELKLLEKIIQSTKQAHFRDKNYVRYYLSLFITIIRSSPFDFIWFDTRCKNWRGSPIIFKKLVSDNAFRLFLKDFKNYEVIPICLLSMILNSIDRRRSLICRDKEEKHLASYFEDDLLPKGFSVLDFSIPTGNYLPVFSDIEPEIHLKILAETESEAIRRIFTLHSKSYVGKINSIPEFLLETSFKRRIEYELAVIK